MKIPLILHTRILLLKLVFYFNILHVNITKSKEKKNSISKLYMKWYYNEYGCYDISEKLILLIEN